MNKFDNIFYIFMGGVLIHFAVNEKVFGEVHFWDNIWPYGMVLFGAVCIMDGFTALFKGSTSNDQDKGE